MHEQNLHIWRWSWSWREILNGDEKCLIIYALMWFEWKSFCPMRILVSFDSIKLCLCTKTVLTVKIQCFCIFLRPKRPQNFAMPQFLHHFIILTATQPVQSWTDKEFKMHNKCTFSFLLLSLLFYIITPSFYKQKQRYLSDTACIHYYCDKMHLLKIEKHAFYKWKKIHSEYKKKYVKRLCFAIIYS